MTDEQRLSLDGYKRAVQIIEDHWPTRDSKWKRADAIYPTFARFSDRVVVAAARSLIASHGRFQPSPADLVEACKAEVVRIMRDRAEETGRPGHPRGCVWGVHEDRPDGMSVIVCAICLDEKIVPTTVARADGPVHVEPDLDPSDPQFG